MHKLFLYTEEAGHDTTLTFLIFRLLKNYDDIGIQHGRHLPVDFCYTRGL